MENRDRGEYEKELFALFAEEKREALVLGDQAGRPLWGNAPARELFGPFGGPGEAPDLLRELLEGEQAATVREIRGRLYNLRLRRRGNRRLLSLNEWEGEELSESLYRRSLLYMGQPVVLTDKEGKIFFVNPQFEELYGFTLAEVRGKTPRILNPGRESYYNMGFPPERYDAQFAEMWQRISDPRTASWSGEIPNQKKDGSLVWVELKINGVFSEEGELSHYVGIPQDMTERRDRELSSQLEIFKTVTDLAELRDNDTGNHILRVAQYSRRIAEKIGMPYKFCEDIQQYAAFHDVGKVGVPDEILLKKGRLSPEEFAVMKEHTRQGFDLLKSKSIMQMAADIARSHHERFDGTGYPDGLKGEEIPLSARIIAIADVYDALRSRRPYKEPWPHDRAIEEMAGLRGSHFDPELLDAFMAIKDQILTISLYLAD